nr:Ig-like domain-containing protein [Lachnospiraceae bacterium]
RFDGITVDGAAGTLSGNNNNTTSTFNNINKTSVVLRCTSDGEYDCAWLSQIKVYYDYIPVTAISAPEEFTIAKTEVTEITAATTPSNASCQKLKWSVIGTAVKLYSDEDCTQEVSASTLTDLSVFVKGIGNGTATITAVSASDSTKSATIAATVSGKPDQTVTAPTAATNLTYTGQTLALLTSGAVVTSGNTAEGSVLYKVGDAGTWSTTIPSMKNAGNYNVYYKVLENDDYSEYMCAEPISVTINKADPATPPVLTAKYGQYLSEITLPHDWYWYQDNIRIQTLGEDTYWADYIPSGDDAQNYNAKYDVGIKIDAGQGDAAISFAEDTVTMTFGWEPSSNTLYNTGDATPVYTSSNKNVAEVSSTGYLDIKGAGETTITATVEDNARYAYATKSVSYKLIVNKIETNISEVPVASEIRYGLSLADSRLSGGAAVFYGTHLCEGTFAWVNSSIKPAVSDSEKTEYEVKFIPSNPNFEEKICKVKIKVNKAKAPIAASELGDNQKPKAKTGDDAAYTGSPISLVNAPVSVPEGYKAFYSKDGTNWTETVPTGTNKGNYTVNVKYVNESGNYEDIILDDISVTITPPDKTKLSNAIREAKEFYDSIKNNEDYAEVVADLAYAMDEAQDYVNEENATKSEVNTAFETLKNAISDAEKAAFEGEKKILKTEADALLEEKDSNESKKLVANAKAAIDALTYDASKSFEENMDAIGAVIVKLKADLAAQRKAEMKEAQSAISLNAGLKISQTGSIINISWGKDNEADGYDIYVAYCGKSFGKPITTVNKKTVTSVRVGKIGGKKINLRKNFKMYVASYKLVNGKKKILAKTIEGHVVGRKNATYTNAKKITLSKSKYSIAVGKTAKIKAKTVLVDKKKKQLSNAHAKEFRYASTDKRIATVDGKGKIKGITKGTCYIYVYARNGYAKRAKVTVK